MHLSVGVLPRGKSLAVGGSRDLSDKYGTLQKSIDKTHTHLGERKFNVEPEVVNSFETKQPLIGGHKLRFRPKAQPLQQAYLAHPDTVEIRHSLNVESTSTP